MSSTDSSWNGASRRVAIVGAGLVGCLASIAFSRQGWAVELYDARMDMRLPEARASLARRSINLAISSRAITALRVVDPAMADRLLEGVIPMHGRMIHTQAGKLDSQKYSTKGEAINAIDRAKLNEDLLNEALSHPNVHAFFEHKLRRTDFDTRRLTFELSSGESKVVDGADLVVGADGAYSAVRTQMMRVVRMDYEQHYIPHAYLELSIPPGPFDASGQPTFLLDPNHLHIWPRHSFMLIALPNKDRSFTCTLFAPFSELDKLQTHSDVLDFFKRNFPDAVPLMGEKDILRDWDSNPKGSLITLKCSPYHYKDRVILLGDAAHSMVPFYGQGMNAGFEDVRVLQVLLSSHAVSSHRSPSSSTAEGVDPALARAFGEYTETRRDDLSAIVDLAMDNYVEMRHSVTTPLYILRKKLDALLSHLLPAPSVSPTALYASLFPTHANAGWLSLYEMVTFRPDIGYADARRRSKDQARIIKNLAKGMVVAAVGAVGVLGWKGLRGRELGRAVWRG